MKATLRAVQERERAKARNMTRILIVEDDPIIRRTVDYTLKRAGFETDTSDNGAQALERARTSHPDLVLLDVMLPGLDGFGFAEQLRRTDGDAAIIMVTALDQPQDLIRGLDSGADDYITKPFSMEELLARVRANLRRVRERSALAHDEPIEVGDLVVEPSQFRVLVKGRPVRLRLKEFQLLLALASVPGTLMTRQRLAEEIWGYEFMPSSRTIDVHIQRVRQAVEEPSDFIYVHTVHGLGYRLEPVLKAEAGARVESPEGV
jgi:DNA-binding response OmpR family regulator